jgi:hypothetical protein
MHIGYDSEAELLELRASVPTPEGRLEVVAKRRGGRWWIIARCGMWNGVGLASDLGPAVAAALAPYADAAAIGDASR